MSRGKKNPEFEYEVVQGEELTREEFDRLARSLARMIYENISKSAMERVTIPQESSGTGSQA
jgi:predicted secreted protein